MKSFIKILFFLCFIFFSVNSVLADSITKPYTFSAGTPASASEVNADFDAIYEQVNKIGSVINIVNGNVGIGSTKPGSKLVVTNNGYVGDTEWTVAIDSETSDDTTGIIHLRNSDADSVFYARSDGNVGIGTATPTEKLEVNGVIKTSGLKKLGWITVEDGYLKREIAARSDGNNTWRYRYAPFSNGNLALQVTKDSWDNADDIKTMFKIGNNEQIILKGNVGIETETPNRTLTVNGDAGGTTAWSNDSDERLKKNVTTIENALEKVQKLRGVSFEWKETENHPEGKQLGFIAQESTGIVPEVIDKKGEYYSMQYAPLTALLVEAVKELKAENEALKAIICEEHPDKEICR